jgi:hypothetical protein
LPSSLSILYPFLKWAEKSFTHFVTHMGNIWHYYSVACKLLPDLSERLGVLTQRRRSWRASSPSTLLSGIPGALDAWISQAGSGITVLRCQILGGAIHGDFIVVRTFARNAQQNRDREA